MYVVLYRFGLAPWPLELHEAHTPLVAIQVVGPTFAPGYVKSNPDQIDRGCEVADFRLYIVFKS